MRNTTRRRGAAILLGLSLVLGACSGPTPGTPPAETPPTETPPQNPAPAAPTGLTATSSPTGTVLKWNANIEDDLAGYRVFRSAAEGGPFQLLTPQPIQATTWTDTSAPVGTTQYYQVVAVDTAGAVSPPATVSATRPAEAPRVEVQNLTAAPGSDRVVFNRIGPLVNPPSNRVHDRAVLRVKNVGAVDLHITDLPVVGPWTVTPSPSASSPLTVPPGGSVDLTVRFVAEGPGNVANHLHEGSLTVTSDGGNPTVGLSGLWQRLPENNVEPSVDQIRRAFGYTFSFVDPGAPVGDYQVIPGLDHQGRVAPNGDEVISPYWQQADPARPVSVTPLAAFHTQGNPATLSWFPKGGSDLHRIVTTAGSGAQAILPTSGETSVTTVTFTPSATFGLNVDGAEWSDPTKNRHGPDLAAGCAEPCGHHMRFWPVRDSAGQPVPDTYLMIMDYAGVNYDYNDNVYLISNMKPAPLLVNVGGPTFTAPDGNVWVADNYNYTDQNGAKKLATYYTPSNAIAQPNTPTTVAIANTDNPQLYRTYRHNTLDTPLPQRVMTFRFPLDNGSYGVKLHFAEINWNAAGKRVFNVSVEGVPILNNFDIFAQAGGKNRALVIPVPNVQVTDKELTIQLKATVDFPNISGIEVTR